MKSRALVIRVALGLLALVGAMLLGYALGRHSPPPPAAAQPRAVLYWFDPMVPDQHFAKPGKSPFMDMDLVPKYADEASQTAVTVDAAQQQNLGIRRATVRQQSVAPSIEALGTLRYDERQIAVVQARSTGFVAEAARLANGDRVRAGQALGWVTLPEWAAAQEEYLLLRQAAEPALQTAARQRLARLGMPEEQIRQLEQRGRVDARQAILAPQSGVLETFELRAGMTLSAGQTLAQIRSTDPIWLEAALPESAAAELANGQPLRFTLTAFPGETFRARYLQSLPALDSDTRTVRFRAEVANPGGRLKAGMQARVAWQAPASAASLWVPSSSVIRSGPRDVVIVDDHGRFSPVVVTVGRELAEETEILQGLAAGQTVVSSGQFLLDSEANLRGVLAKMPPALTPATGRIEALQGAEITLSHEAIPQLDWPAMTMPFRLANPALAQGFKVGERVRFAFSIHGSQYTVERLERQQP